MSKRDERQERRDARRERLDRNDDGKVSLKERLHRLDRNVDGRITIDDLPGRMRWALRGVIARIVDAADKDDDGKADGGELLILIASLIASALEQHPGVR